jgi:hypothetical protein
MEKLTVWREITTRFNDRAVTGSYAVENGVLTVKTPRGQKSANLGALSTIFLAARLLRELAAEGKV